MIDVVRCLNVILFCDSILPTKYEIVPLLNAEPWVLVPVLHVLVAEYCAPTLLFHVDDRSLHVRDVFGDMSCAVPRAHKSRFPDPLPTPAFALAISCDLLVVLHKTGRNYSHIFCYDTRTLQLVSWAVLAIGRVPPLPDETYDSYPLLWLRELGCLVVRSASAVHFFRLQVKDGKRSLITVGDVLIHGNVLCCETVEGQPHLLLLVAVEIEGPTTSVRIFNVETWSVAFHLSLKGYASVHSRMGLVWVTSVFEGEYLTSKFYPLPMVARLSEDKRGGGPNSTAACTIPAQLPATAPQPSASTSSPSAGSQSNSYAEVLSQSPAVRVEWGIVHGPVSPDSAVQFVPAGGSSYLGTLALEGGKRLVARKEWHTVHPFGAVPDCEVRLPRRMIGEELTDSKLTVIGHRHSDEDGSFGLHLLSVGVDGEDVASFTMIGGGAVRTDRDAVTHIRKTTLAMTSVAESVWRVRVFELSKSIPPAEKYQAIPPAEEYQAVCTHESDISEVFAFRLADEY